MPGSRSPGSAAPYLSIVVCSRNDDHGGQLIDRMQAFMDGLAWQCQVHGLRAELIIVEWNPPEGRPRLMSALREPPSAGWLDVRVIEVPPTFHRRLRNSDSLGLYQMIAKNVGIRRARGEFVLATNIDILFSTELTKVLSSGTLQPGRYYRVDRHDVPADVPERGSPEEQLEYCKSHVLRVSKKEYSIDLATGRVLRIYPESRGMRKIHAFLWAVGPVLVFNAVRISYGPWFRELRERSKNRRPPPPLRSRLLLMMRDFRRGVKVGPTLSECPPLQYIDRSLALLEKSLSSRPPRPRKTRKARSWNPRPIQIMTELLTLPPPDRPWLYTNASGDFTLMSKRDWERLRGYPEFEMYSLHIDSILLYEAYFAGVQEVTIKHPIYHIDHAKGWAPFYFDQDKFTDDMKRRNIPLLSYDDFLRLTEPMVKSGRAVLFNRPDWGLGDDQLEESPLAAGHIQEASI